MDGLTVRQAKFVVEFVKDWNATAASLRAGYSNGQSGRHLIRQPTIRAAVQAEMDEIAKETFISRDTQISEMRRIAADPECPHQTRVAALKHASELAALTRTFDTQAAAETLEALVARADGDAGQGD